MSAGVALKRSEPSDGDHLAIATALDRKRPVGDQVYEALKQAIVTLRVMPGTSISENRICRHLSVSRTPVRMALVRLAEDNLIDIYPQQGSYVAPIRLGGIADSHFIRRALEVGLLREAAQVWTPAMSHAARAIIASQAAAIAAGEDDLFHAEDERFHAAFAGFAGREGVWHTVLAARSRLTRFLRLFGNSQRLPDVVAEHTAIVDALDLGRGEEAIMRLEYHLDRIFALLDQLPEQYRPYLAD